MTKKLTILIIEDEEPFLRILADYIEEIGHMPLAAFNQFEAESIMCDRRVDAIIMDVFIKPAGGGKIQNIMGLITKIRHVPNTSFLVDRMVPILVISGGVEIEGGYSPLRTARRLHAIETLRKPFSEKDIKHWVDRLV